MTDDKRTLTVIDGDLADTPPLRRTAEVDRTCYVHRTFVIIRRDRRVECGDCGATVEAFDALAQLEYELDRYAGARERAKTEAKRQEKRLADLKRQVRNAQAQLRRAEARCS